MNESLVPLDSECTSVEDVSKGERKEASIIERGKSWRFLP